MQAFKIEEEFEINANFNVTHIHTVNKKNIEEIANKLGYQIDYAWHPSYSDVFGETKGTLKKIFFKESIILHDLSAAGSTYEKFLEEAKENPEFKENAKRDYKELSEKQDREGQTDERVKSYESDDLEIFHEEELTKVADKKMFERYGGIIFLDSIQEQEYKKIMEWGWSYGLVSPAHLVHLKSIKSEKPKVLFIPSQYTFKKSKEKPKIDYDKINETQWKKYLEILKKNLEN